MFELNTGNKQAGAKEKNEVKEDLQLVREQLTKYFIEDARQLDKLLGTSFSEKWFVALTSQ